MAHTVVVAVDMRRAAVAVIVEGPDNNPRKIAGGIVGLRCLVVQSYMLTFPVLRG